MKIQIPHPCDKLDLDLLDNYKDVSEVYLKGPTDKFGTGRVLDYRISDRAFSELCKEIHSRGRGVNVILNATCFGGAQYTKNWLSKTLKYFNFLSSLDVDVLTVADPYLIATIKHYGFSFKTSVSVLSFVLNATRARYFDEMEVDRITLAPDVNRDIESIRQIRKTVKCELGVIVNEGCLPHCPNRVFCYNFTSHTSVQKKFLAQDNVNIFGAYHWFYDVMVRVMHPHLLLMSPWIRPENLEDYERLGISIFKISGRNKPHAFLERSLKAYHSRNFEGNMFDLLDGGVRLPHEFGGDMRENFEPSLFYIDNKDLGEFFDRVMKCSKNCTECGYCEEFAKSHLKESEDIPQAFRRVYVRLFKEAFYHPKSTDSLYVWMP